MAQFNQFEIVQEVELACSTEQLWRALTDDIEKWWAFHVGEEGSTISLDGHLGGHFEERWGEGEGVSWGEVIDLRRGRRLRLRGTLSMTGPAINDFTYELEGKGQKTTLKLTHHGSGYLDVKAEGDYTQGWVDLLDGYLRAWVEEGKAYNEVQAA